MLGFPLGILSAAGAGAVVGDYELIATELVGADTPSVTFSSLATYASTYKHLQIRAVARTNRVSDGDTISLTLNGDTGTNYRTHLLFGNGSTVTSSAPAFTGAALVNRLTATNSTANAFGAVIIDLLEPFSTSKNKTIRHIGGATNQNEIVVGSGVRFNTESTNSISFTSNGDYVAGSRFSLYGIKG